MKNGQKEIPFARLSHQRREKKNTKLKKINYIDASKLYKPPKIISGTPRIGLPISRNNITSFLILGRRISIPDVLGGKIKLLKESNKKWKKKKKINFDLRTALLVVGKFFPILQAGF